MLLRTSRALLQKESLLPVRFSVLSLPEQDDSNAAGDDCLSLYGGLGCSLHCKGCGAKLFHPNDLVRVDPARRPSLADGDVFCLQDSPDTVTVGMTARICVAWVLRSHLICSSERSVGTYSSLRVIRGQGLAVMFPTSQGHDSQVSGLVLLRTCADCHPWPRLLAGDVYEYREISLLGILSLLQVYIRKRACDISCASCGLYLGMKVGD